MLRCRAPCIADASDARRLVFTVWNRLLRSVVILVLRWNPVDGTPSQLILRAGDRRVFRKAVTVRLVYRYLFLFLVLAGGIVPSVATAQDGEIDGRFSDVLISELGYPLVDVHVGPDGIDAPSELAPGYYHVRLTSEEPYVGYLNIVQVPEGLTQEEEEEQALLAGAWDLPQEGWTYFGGTNTAGPGEPVSFAIELAEGEYKFAAFYYEPYGPEGGEEVMRLAPLTVSADAGTPVADQVAPEEAVTLEMTDDLQYIVTPATIEAGPQIWKLENTGTERSHHIVIMGVPEGTTADDILAEFHGLMMGTPPAEDSVMAGTGPFAYGAMQSGGTVTYTEFDFEPGTYAVICYIMDDEQSMPHVMDGMVTIFNVE
jgi:hypothetical protein